MDFIKITEDVISVEEATKQVTDPSCGAISLFVGTTRDTFEGQNVVTLEYECYQEMAEKEIKKLCDKSREKWSLHHIAVYHRLGLVPIAEASIILAVGSKHRRESLAAVAYLIDELKANVPIWKKEIYDDGSSNWKQNKECVWTKDRPNHNDSPTISKRKRGDKESSIPMKKIKTEPEDTSELSLLPIKRETDEPSDKIDVDSVTIDKEFVQITASQEELCRRIEAFQQRKREELDVLNVQEFCTMPGSVTSANSCARTSAIVLRSKDSNSHLKLTRVVNEWGPQTVGSEMYPVRENTVKQGSTTSSSNSSREGSVEPASMAATNKSVPVPDLFKTEPTEDTPKESLPPGLDERLHNLESHLKIASNTPVPRDVYSRLKALEDRVLHLEGISPEYFEGNKIKMPDVHRAKKKEIKAVEDDLSLNDVSVKIHELKKKLKERQLKHAF